MTKNDILTDNPRDLEFVSHVFETIKELNTHGKTKFIHDLCDAMIQLYRPDEKSDIASEQNLAH